MFAIAIEKLGIVPGVVVEKSVTRVSSSGKKIMHYKTRKRV